jgi:phosphoribosylformylglycinamidine (FGAM) synthase-like enzyme
VRKAVTMDVKRPGDIVYVLGKTFPELGGSEWYALHNAIGNGVPKVHAQKAKALYESLHRAIRAGLVASCHDCSDGGLGVALAETAFAGGLGLEIDLRAVPAEGIARNDELLFSESQSRFVITVAPGSRDAFEAHLGGSPFARIGTVIPEQILRIDGIEGTRIISEELAALKAAWQKPLAF